MVHLGIGISKESVMSNLASFFLISWSYTFTGLSFTHKQGLNK